MSPATSQASDWGKDDMHDLEEYCSEGIPQPPISPGLQSGSANGSLNFPALRLELKTLSMESGISSGNIACLCFMRQDHRVCSVNNKVASQCRAAILEVCAAQAVHAPYHAVLLVSHVPIVPVSSAGRDAASSARIKVSLVHQDLRTLVVHTHCLLSRGWDKMIDTSQLEPMERATTGMHGRSSESREDMMDRGRHGSWQCTFSTVVTVSRVFSSCLLYTSPSPRDRG
eukprot:6330414-Amphidinium_carterae.2